MREPFSVMQLASQLAHVLAPPTVDTARRGPSSSSGSRQRANSARWSLAIWTGDWVMSGWLFF